MTISIRCDIGRSFVASLASSSAPGFNRDWSSHAITHPLLSSVRHSSQMAYWRNSFERTTRQAAMQTPTIVVTLLSFCCRAAAFSLCYPCAPNLLCLPCSFFAQVLLSLLSFFRKACPPVDVEERQPVHKIERIGNCSKTRGRYQGTCLRGLNCSLMCTPRYSCSVYQYAVKYKLWAHILTELL